MSTFLLAVGLLVTFLFAPKPENQPKIFFTYLAIVAISCLLLCLYSLWEEIKQQKKTIPIVLLPPLLFTLSVGLFYYALPPRWLSRIAMLIIFTSGFYATLLVQNIYAISVARSIKLLQAAKTIGFLLSVITALGYYYVIFSSHLPLPLVTIFIFIISLFLITPVIWSISLKDSLEKTELQHIFVLSLVLTEIGTFITFWPVFDFPLFLFIASSFLAICFYSFVGLSQHWLENRLFGRVLREFIAVVIIVFVVLFFVARWGG